MCTCIYVLTYMYRGDSYRQSKRTTYESTENEGNLHHLYVKSVVMACSVKTEDYQRACTIVYMYIHNSPALWRKTLMNIYECCSLSKSCLSSQVLQTLSHLPITTRNQLTDSHLLTMVTRWLKPTTKQPEQVSSITGPPQSLEDGAEALQSHSQQQATLESSMEG